MALIYWKALVAFFNQYKDQTSAQYPLIITAGYLVAEGCQVGRRLLSYSSDLSRRHQSEDVLDGGGGVDPELIPEGIVCGLYGLQDRSKQVSTT